jgi:hypothetical protein
MIGAHGALIAVFFRSPDLFENTDMTTAIGEKRGWCDDKDPRPFPLGLFLIRHFHKH